MHICIVSPDYPTSKTIDFVFVDQLCRALALKGIDVTVIAPQSITKCLLRHVPITKRKQRIYISKDVFFTLIRPKYISVGNTKGILKHHNGNAYRKAVQRGYKQINTAVDVLYGHFWGAVLAAYYVARKRRIPLIASSGEEIINQKRIGYTNEQIQNVGDYVSGIIHVSSNNFNECKEIGLTRNNKSIVIPNAINDKLFYLHNRERCRTKLNIKSDDFVGAFVGQFIPRKGTLRVNAALKELNDNRIKAFFIGRGPDMPDYSGIKKCGLVPHDKLPEYLSASDIFVLPTENEGCCNAIIEALACGLPVISSNRPFNFDILNNSNSVLVEPNSISDIAATIKMLQSDSKLRSKLSTGALNTVKSLTLEQRADRVLNFIKERIEYDRIKAGTK